MARIYEGVPAFIDAVLLFPGKGFLCFRDITHANERRPTCNLTVKRNIIEYSLNGYQRIFSRANFTREVSATVSRGLLFFPESFERLTFLRKRARIFLRTRQTNVNSRNLALEMHASLPVSLSLIGILSSHKSPLFCFRSFMFCFRPPAPDTRRHCEAL